MIGLIAAVHPFVGAQWLTVPRTAEPYQAASWIWVQKPGQPTPTVHSAAVGTVHMECEWTVEGDPVAATAWFTADNESRLTINGREIGRSAEWSQVQKVDLVGVLHKGVNRITVEATNQKGTAETNPGGFLFAMTAQNSAGKCFRLVSDDSWRSPEGRVVRLGAYDTEPWSLRGADVPCPLFRREFTLKGQVKKAVAHVIGLGQYDFFVNGQRQGDGFLNGPWSQYNRRIYWQDFDVTSALKSGGNALGVVLGNSFYRVAQPPAGRYAKGDAMPDFSGENPYLLSVAVDITMQDGRTERIVTDRRWRWNTGPFELSHVYAGEDYDATKERAGWNRPGYRANDWHAPKVAEPPKATLQVMDWPLMKAAEIWKATRVFRSPRGTWNYVFPQNAMAVMRFRVHGKAGARVSFKPSEVMTEEGNVEQLNLWGGRATCDYVLQGGVPEDHEWRFFYHGFQFVEVSGAVPKGEPNPDGLPVLDSVEMVHIRTANPTVGAFKTDSTLLNQTHSLVDWAMRSNMAFSMTDCPTREKLGWLECAHLLFRPFAYSYDSQAWFRKISRDIRDIQLPDGRITTVAPDYLMLPPSSPYKFTIEWGAAGVLMPWEAYRWYGDREFLTSNYDSMRGFVDWIDRNSPEGIAPPGLGDWYDYGHGEPPGPSRYTPTELTSTAMWGLCLQAVIGASEAMGDAETAAHYRSTLARVREAFQSRFYDAKAHRLKNSGSVQSGHAMALCAGLIPDGDRTAVLDAIVQELESRGYQQTPGDVGHLYFIRALAEAGRSDVLHRVYARESVGSYGGILKKGLTTLPETWDAITVGSNSLNHCMLGHVMEWFYGWVLGIRQTDTSVGWSDLLIAPEPGPLHLAEGETRTPRGVVKVNWRVKGEEFTLDVTVPPGKPATALLPTGFSEATLDGKVLKMNAGLLGRRQYLIAPGTHRIVARPN